MPEETVVVEGGPWHRARSRESSFVTTSGLISTMVASRSRKRPVGAHDRGDRAAHLLAVPRPEPEREFAAPGTAASPTAGSTTVCSTASGDVIGRSLQCPSRLVRVAITRTRSAPAVEHDAEIKLALERFGDFHIDPLDDPSSGPVCFVTRCLPKSAGRGFVHVVVVSPAGCRLPCRAHRSGSAPSRPSASRRVRWRSRPSDQAYRRPRRAGLARRTRTAVPSPDIRGMSMVISWMDAGLLECAAT